MNKVFTVNTLLKALGDNGCTSSTFFTDFSSSTGWLSVANDVGGVAVTGGQLTGWGADGGVTREIYYDLPINDGITISDINWVAEFDFQWKTIGTSSNPGHTPFTLSDSIATTDSFQTAPPVASTPHPRSISIHVGNHNAFNIDRGLQILVKDTTTTTNSSTAGLSGIIDLDGFADTTVYPRLERLTATTYRLSVFTDSARTIHVTGTASGADSPITLTALQVVTSTNFIHSSNSSAGGGGRTLAGFLDNLEINNGATVGGCPTLEIDACLSLTALKTFLVDAILQVQQIKVFTIDACLTATKAEAFTIDSILVGTKLTFTTDGLLAIMPSKMYGIDVVLKASFTEDFLVDSILIPRTCSPWLNLANGDSSVQRITRNAGQGQGIEFPLVNVDTYVTGFKIRLQRVGGASGAFNCKIFLYPPSQDSGGAIGVAGTSDTLSGASIPSVLTETTAVFDPPVKLVPNQRYMIGFLEGLDSGTGINYETRVTTGTQYQYSFQHPNSGSPPNWINLLSTDRQIAGDILVLNGDASLCITVNAILTKITAWQFREQRTRNDQAPSGGAPDITFSNEPTRLKIDSTTGSIGFGWVFKTFLLSEITGSTLKADWAGTGVAQIRVYDGRYERTNFGDFIPKDDNQNPVATLQLKGAGLLGDIQTIAPSSTTTLDVGSINYAGALLEEVTVFIKLNDTSNASAGDLNISSITVTGNGSVYNFTNPTLVQENTATEFDWGFVDATSITTVSILSTGFLVDAILVESIVVVDKTFLVDAILKSTFNETFLVDARLIIRQTFDFLVDGLIQAKPQIPFEFIVDGIVRYAQGTILSGGIPDLIIRVLTENPPSLTGRQIIEEIVIITSNPAEGFSFRGKTSRIKNWLNRLLLDNLIQEDGSDPDWYDTNWSLV